MEYVEAGDVEGDRDRMDVRGKGPLLERADPLEYREIGLPEHAGILEDRDEVAGVLHPCLGIAPPHERLGADDPLS